MNVKIRPALLEDAHSMVEILTQVKMRTNMSETISQSGFLIESSLEKYQYFIANDNVLVAEEIKLKKVVGFSIVLGHETIDKSGIKQKTDQIRWEKSFFNTYNGNSFAFYEQIAFLPKYAKRIYVTYLAFMSLWWAFQNYTGIFGAVVCYPIPNEAPLQYMDLIGWQKVGSVEEKYPEYGTIGYDIYYLDRAVFEDKLKERRFADFLDRLRANGYLP